MAEIEKEITLNIMSRTPRILEDAPRRVVVETKTRRNLLGLPTRQAPSIQVIDHAVAAAALTAVSASGEPPPPSDHDKVFAHIASGEYEAAAKLAARLINADNDAGFFRFGGTAEFGLVDQWLSERVIEASFRKNSEFCELTPELAQLLLLRNDGNRRVNAANLAAIMRDMASDRWAANGETIIVARSGQLNDGQHRCFAALLIGGGIETAIAFGVERSSIATVDIGRKRTGADRLGINGVTNYVPMSAISNLILEMRTGRKPTPAETDAFFDLNRELIEAAHSAAGANMKGIGPSAPGAAAAYLLSIDHNPAMIAAFFASVRSGEMMPKRDPRFVLHKHIFDARFKVKLSRENWVRAFVAHFIAHRNSKTMQSVNYDVTLDWGI